MPFGKKASASDSASETVTREVAEARGPRRTGACCVSSTVGWGRTDAIKTVTREVAEARGPRRTGACCVSSTVGWVERMPSKP